MRISRRTSGFGGLSLAMLFASLVVGGLSPAAPVNAQESVLDFFSILPAKPQLKTPEIGGAPVGPSDEMKQARQAYQSGDFASARGYLENASAKGDIVASWYLGHMYRLGRGVPASLSKAYHYYSVVAEAFTPDEPDPRRLRIMIDALVRVADIYRKGDPDEGIARNFPVAFQLYNTASSYGHPAAHHAEGLMILKGQGVKANPSKGLKWLILAAKKRYPPAEALLGDLYWKGEIVKRDRVRGLMWYTLASQSARPEENPEIFDRLTSMQGQASEEQRLTAEKRAAEWAEKYPLPPPAPGGWDPS
jgi:TPR repeat protein